MEGETIEIVVRNPDGWFEGYIGADRHGVFPGNYVEELGDSAV